jgi:flagellar hook assembly protein FlgD
VTLALHVPRGGPVVVEVHDLAGRRVRTLHRGNTEAGVLELRWDGRDDSGRTMGAGVYHARAVAGTDESLARFVIVR